MLNNLLEPTLAQAPDRVAASGSGRQFTYRALEEHARRLAAHLLYAGLNPNDRVALWMGNSPELLTAYLACWKAGLIAVPLDYRYQPRQVEPILHDSTTRAVILDAERQANLADTHYLRQLDCIIVAQGAPALNRAVPFDAPAPAARIPEPDSRREHLSTIFYTSGTTSRAKGVVHSDRRIRRRVETLIRECRLDADTVSLVCLSLMRPLSFQLQALAVLAVGGCVVTLRRFSADDFWKEYIAPPAKTLLAFAPNQLAAVLENPRAQAVDYAPLRLCVAGGDAVPLPLHDLFEKCTGMQLVEMCGMTETGPYAMNPPFGRKKRGYIGLPLDGVCVRIVDEHGVERSVGQTGEIVVQTADGMIGYWNDTLRTCDVVRDGWLYTGDIGHCDSDGYLHFDGRIKELIVRDGTNIAPTQVEECLEQHPAIQEAIVVGVDDPPHGQAVEAFLCWNPGAVDLPSFEQLQSYVANQLQTEAVPRVLHVLESWPRTAQGKIDRHKLQTLAAARAGQE